MTESPCIKKATLPYKKHKCQYYNSILLQQLAHEIGEIMKGLSSPFPSYTILDMPSSTAAAPFKAAALKFESKNKQTLDKSRSLKIFKKWWIGWVLVEAQTVKAMSGTNVPQNYFLRLFVQKRLIESSMNEFSIRCRHIFFNGKYAHSLNTHYDMVVEMEVDNRSPEYLHFLFLALLRFIRTLILYLPKTPESCSVRKYNTAQLGFQITGQTFRYIAGFSARRISMERDGGHRPSSALSLPTVMMAWRIMTECWYVIQESGDKNCSYYY
ncbi:Leptin receptor [Varanus komodoensis]|nr:Leptin receptor [Varanus komodoensis]